MNEIRNIVRVVLILKKSDREDIWKRHFFQGDIGNINANDLLLETGTFPKYLLRNNPDTQLMGFDSWRFLSIQGDTLGDISVYFYPSEIVFKKGALALKQKKFSGGIDFAYISNDGSSDESPLFFWIPLPIPGLLENFIIPNVQIEEKTCIVFNHPDDVCSKVCIMGGSYCPKIDVHFAIIKEIPQPNTNDIFLFAGSTSGCQSQFIDQVYGIRSETPLTINNSFFEYINKRSSNTHKT